MRRLVTHSNPENRETPLLLLAELRAIDPTIELVYFGERDWRLGSVRPNDFRRQKGEALLAMEARRPVAEQNPKNRYIAKLSQEGFAQIAKYIDLGDPSGAVLDESGVTTTILADFSSRHDAWIQDGGEEVFKQRMSDTLGEKEKAEAAALAQQYAVTDGRAHYRREMRGKVTFGYGGMTGGRGALITP